MERISKDGFIQLAMQPGLSSRWFDLALIPGDRHQLLEPALREAELLLAQLLSRPELLHNLQTWFPGGGDITESAWLERAEQAVAALAGGLRIALELRDSTELAGAQGAFIAAGPDGAPRIVLSQASVSNLSSQDLTRLVLEETGHWIDALIHGANDSQGDEGEAFAAGLLGLSLQPQMWQRIRNENDAALINLDGQLFSAELASTLSIADLSVNEGSPFAVFTVSGAANQSVTLTLDNVSTGLIRPNSAEPFTVNTAKLTVYGEYEFGMDSQLSGDRTVIRFNGPESSFTNSNTAAIILNGTTIGSVSFHKPEGFDDFGGAGITNPALSFAGDTRTSTDRYMRADDGRPVTVTLNTPQSYLGFWWSAGGGGNVVEFWSGGSLIESFNTGALDGQVPEIYKGNPNTGASNATQKNTGERYAFLNIFLKDGQTFDQVVFKGGGFEFDNLTLGNIQPPSCSSISGLETYSTTSGWTTYTAGSPVLLDENGTLLVRTALAPEQELALDTGDLFRLIATDSTDSNHTATGTATILDNGTGVLYSSANTTGTPESPGTNGLPAALDNDVLPLLVNADSTVINEKSPYAFFTISGSIGQPLSLSLASVAGLTSGDLNRFTLEFSTDGVSNGDAIWFPYTWDGISSGNRPVIPASGSLQVRVGLVALNNATNDDARSLSLNVRTDNNITASGTALFSDDGNCAIFNADGTENQTVVKDDDRPLTINSFTVNEGSAYAIFTVTGGAGQQARLELENITTGLPRPPEAEPFTVKTTNLTVYGEYEFAMDTQLSGDRTVIRFNGPENSFSNSNTESIILNGQTIGSITYGKPERYDTFGGAGITNATLTYPGETRTNDDRYMRAGDGSPVTVTLTEPQSYLGFWWSAGSGGNVVELYENGSLIEHFDTSALDGKVPAIYGGNPNTGALDTSQENFGQKYAFLNIFLNNGQTYDQAIFKGGGFEFDNLTIGSIASPEEREIKGLETFNPTTGLWTPYVAGSIATLDSEGKLLVRTSLLPEQENELDPGETFNLIATNASTPEPSYGLETSKFRITAEAEFAMETQLTGIKTVIRFDGAENSFNASNTENIVLDGIQIGTITYPKPERFDDFGGAGITNLDLTYPGDTRTNNDRYVRAKDSAQVTVELTTAQSYLGFWWSAGDSANIIEFYSDGQLIETFSSSLLASITPELFFGNPNTSATNSEQKNNGQRYAFLNCFAKDGQLFDKLVLRGDNFEFDNLTFGILDPPAGAGAVGQAVGTATIVDEANGVLFSSTNTTGIPDQLPGEPGDGLPEALDDDRPPVATDDSFSVAKNGTTGPLNLLANDTDPNDDPLSLVSINGIALTTGTAQTIAVANGTVNVSATGVITFTPDPDYTGPISFPYIISDGKFTANATVNGTVPANNDPPVATNDSFSVDKDGTTDPLDLLANDTDSDGNTLAITSINGTTLTPGTAQSIPVTSGTVNVAADGTITFSPTAGYTGPISFPYVISDGTATATANVNGTVTGAGNTPPLAVNDAYTLDEGDSVTGNILTTPTGLDSDPDSDPIDVAEVNGTPFASLTASSNATYPSAQGWKQVPLTNGILYIKDTGEFVYDHDGSETTTDSFTYKVNDGTADSNLATVDLTITPANDPPLAVNDAYTLDEGDSVTGNILTTPTGLDSDPDSDPIDVAEVNGTPFASLTASSNATYPSAQGWKQVPLTNGILYIKDTGEFVYDHDGSETTTDSFTYKVNDGTADSNLATVDLTITPANDPPLAVNDAFSVNQGGTSAGLNLLGNDSDPENDTLSIVSINGTTLTPGTDQSIPVNNGTVDVAADGTITFSPTAGYTGPISFPYVISDGTATDTADVTGTVNPPNNPPVATDDSFSVDKDGTTDPLDLLANDTDSDGNTLAITSINGTTLTPGTAQSIPVTSGTVNVAADGTITFSPTAGYTGPISFPYVISDGTATATANVNGTVTGAGNTPPTNLVKLDVTSDSQDIGDGSTANGLPTLTLLASPGQLDSIILKGSDGQPLLKGQNYRVTEITIDGQRSAYRIELLDADLSQEGAQHFGRYFTGLETGNGPNTTDGTYTVLLNGSVAGSIDIRTSALSASERERLFCLAELSGDGRFDSILNGYRVGNNAGSAADDMIIGTGGSDGLNGGAGSDLLNGFGDRLGGSSFESGANLNQIDVLTGGTGSDYFQLGDIVTSFYIGDADQGYARITDFQSDDKLILSGGADHYTLAAATASGVSGLGLYHNNDLVALIQGSASTSLNLSNPDQVLFI